LTTTGLITAVKLSNLEFGTIGIRPSESTSNLGRRRSPDRSSSFQSAVRLQTPRHQSKNPLCLHHPHLAPFLTTALATVPLLKLPAVILLFTQETHLVICLG
jgi:hypothetical protein